MAETKKKSMKTVVFDWNGTLLDDTLVTMGGMNAVMEAFDRAPIGIEKFRASYDIPIARYYRNLGFSDAEMAAHDFKMVNIFHDYYAENADGAPLFPGASALLAALKQKGARNLILSNHIKTAITPFLEEYGITALIDAVMAYESRRTQCASNFFPAQEKKDLSKGEKLRLFIKEQDQDPATIVILGDTPEETHIARDLGIRSIALTGGYADRARLIAAKPDAILDSLDDVLPTLDAWGFWA